VVRRGVLREVSLVALAADRDTAVSLAAQGKEARGTEMDKQTLHAEQPHVATEPEPKGGFVFSQAELQTFMALGPELQQDVAAGRMRLEQAAELQKVRDSCPPSPVILPNTRSYAGADLQSSLEAALLRTLGVSEKRLAAGPSGPVVFSKSQRVGD